MTNLSGQESHKQSDVAEPQETAEQSDDLTVAEMEAITLPENSIDPVFVFDRTGGFRRVRPGSFEVTPRLRIYADGKVVTGGSSPDIENLEVVISNDELNQFLHFVVNQKQFVKIGNEELKTQMDATGEKLYIADAMTSNFSVNLKSGKREVEVYALPIAVKTFKSVDELGQLLEIERKCEKMIARIHISSDEELGVLVAEVNDNVRKTDSKFAKFALDDLRFATRYKDGKFSATFQKEFPKTADSPALSVSVNVNQPSPAEKREFFVSGLPKKK